MRALNISRKVILLFALAAILVTAAVFILVRQEGEFITPLLAGLGGILSMAAVAVTWNQSLKRQVQQRTAALSKELVERVRVESHRDATLEALQRARDELEMRVEERTGELAQSNAALRAEITERVQAEKARQLERTRLMSILNTIPDGVYIVSQQCDIEYINPVIEREFGPIDGRKCYEYFHDLAEACPWCKNAEVFAGKSVQWEWYSFKNDRHYDLFDTPYKNVDGSISKFEIFYDVTERVRAEEQIKASLREKEVLLQEIHHRVKNNLAIVSSLLKFQAKITPGEEARAAFQESQNRIQTMARIHEHLYRSQDLARIDMAQYVRGVVNHLVQSFGARAIALQVDVADVALDIDRATPCGLIINELVSNALKHAFPPNWQGPENAKVCVGLRLDDDGQCMLTVGDNGAGLPPDLQMESVGRESLGLRLVNLLSRQLEGNLQVDREGGTTFCLAFAMPEQESDSRDE